MALYEREQDAVPSSAAWALAQLGAARALRRDLNQHDAKSFAREHARDARLELVGFPISEGRAAIQASAQQLFQAFPELSFGFSHIWLKRDVAIGEWVLRGRQTGWLASVAPSQQLAGVRGASVMRFAPDGSIRSHIIYVDATTALSQLGVRPEPAREVEPVPSWPIIHAGHAWPFQRSLERWCRSFYDAFESGDRAKIEPLLADDVAFENLVEPAPRSGISGFVSLFDTYTGAFPDNEISEAGEWYVRDVAIVENVTEATHLGAFGPMPATGRPVRLRFLDILQIQRGKMVRGRTYSNNYDLFKQLGLQ